MPKAKSGVYSRYTIKVDGGVVKTLKGKRDVLKQSDVSHWPAAKAAAKA